MLIIHVTDCYLLFELDHYKLLLELLNIYFYSTVQLYYYNSNISVLIIINQK